MGPQLHATAQGNDVLTWVSDDLKNVLFWKIGARRPLKPLDKLGKRREGFAADFDDFVEKTPFAEFTPRGDQNLSVQLSLPVNRFVPDV